MFESRVAGDTANNFVSRTLVSVMPLARYKAAHVTGTTEV